MGPDGDADPVLQPIDIILLRHVDDVFSHKLQGQIQRQLQCESRTPSLPPHPPQDPGGFVTEAGGPRVPPATRVFTCLESITLGVVFSRKRSLPSFLVQQAHFKSLLVVIDPEKFGESRQTQLSAFFFLFYSLMSL